MLEADVYHQPNSQLARAIACLSWPSFLHSTDTLYLYTKVMIFKLHIVSDGAFVSSAKSSMVHVDFFFGGGGGNFNVEILWVFFITCTKGIGSDEIPFYM